MKAGDICKCSKCKEYNNGKQKISPCLVFLIKKNSSFKSRWHVKVLNDFIDSSEEFNELEKMFLTQLDCIVEEVFFTLATAEDVLDL